MLRIEPRIVAAGVLLTCSAGVPAEPGPASPPIGETPAILHHYEQARIDDGRYSFTDLFDAGQRLFDARFNLLDGQGRPETTGGGAPRAPGQPAFIRTSAPDANSCMGCHAQPRSGGAGDFVANVFVLAQTLDPVTHSVEGAFSNERNTLGMFGAGVIEMLAREMTAELFAIREDTTLAAREQGVPVTRSLEAKGVSFGDITVLPDGRVDPTAIDGVDWDLVVKPFHQKGAVVSLREFSNNAMNHHHGMQSVERFGEGADHDNDGLANELTEGDITAVTIYQAALEAPRQVWPKHGRARRAAQQGAETFAAIGCARCHRPSMTLDSRQFSEPNPYNPPGNLGPDDVTQPYTFDLLKTSNSNLVRNAGNGRIEVRAFTDLKRHNLNDTELGHFDNEQVPQGFLHGFADPAAFTVPPQPRPTGEFLSRKLWDVGNSAPYGHRGDLTLMTEAIHWHGGDARVERDAYFDLPVEQQAAVIEFLKTLVVAESRTGPG